MHHFRHHFFGLVFLITKGRSPYGKKIVIIYSASIMYRFATRLFNAQKEPAGLQRRSI